MKVLDLLKGRKINYMTDARVVVQLEIKEAKEHNDENGTTFHVEFSNGFVNNFYYLNDIDLIDENK